MNLDTIQNALKELYYSMGGNANNVRNTTDINAIINAIAALAIGAQINAAAVKELPEFPESDGTYTLQVVMDDGEATLSWEAVE